MVKARHLLAVKGLGTAERKVLTVSMKVES